MAYSAENVHGWIGETEGNKVPHNATMTRTTLHSCDDHDALGSKKDH